MKLSRREEALVYFGNVVMPRLKCPSCGRLALVVDGETTCCLTPISKMPEKSWRECESGDLRRRLPPKAARERILDEQDHRCLYCERQFGNAVSHRGNEYILRVTWDHCVPFCHSRNNQTQNYVAACQFCNNWKNDKMFDDLDQIRVYISNKLAVKWHREIDPGAD